MSVDEWYRGGIAVVGSAVHVAGNTRSSEELFQLLMECRDVAQRVPCTRFNADAFGVFDAAGDRRGKTDAPFGYFCEDISQFDTSPGLFGVAPSECKHVDPQQRQLLLLTADAIRNGGMSISDVFNTNTGVFVGNMNRDYMMLAADGSIINQYSSQGSASAIAANRISFTFNFRGVSVAVDSACSATGIGIHFAANDLLSRNIDMAVVGGFNLIMTPYNFIGLSQLQVLSKTGKTLAFDEGADGYTRGEGGGVVLLKRFEDAVRDGNRILGVIATSATCSNGRSVGAMAAPSLLGQLDMFKRTFERAALRGIRPCDVQYIECHGTGTHRGDAVEVNACGDFFFKHTPAQDRPAAVYIGSVKANVGHLEAGACIPGLVKVLKCIEHKKIPKQIHYHRPNKEIQPEYIERLRIPTEHVSWLAPPGGRPRVAVVNSYGYGGSIAQLLIVEYVPPTSVPRAPSSLPAALVIWGHTKAAVQARRKLHARNLDALPGSPYQYCIGGSLISNNNGGFHSVVVGSTPQQLLEKIDTAAIVPVAHKPQAIALIFPGQGSQGDIPHDLLCTPAYSGTIRQVEDWMQRTGKPYSILSASAYKNSWPLSMQGLFIFSHQIALATLMFDAVPQFKENMPTLLGHSLGEYAVAFLTKELTLNQCCDSIWGIGEALEPLRGTGFMAEVPVSNEIAQRQVDIGCVNSPDRVVISGRNDAMNLAVEAGAIRIPHVEFPFHSSVMDSRKDAVCAYLTKIGVPVDRWWNNIRGCVQFAKALSNLEHRPTIFLELGQQTALSPAAVRTVGIDSFCVTQHVVKSLTTLRQQGYRINWRSIYGSCPLLEESLVELPLHLEPHWFESMDSFRSRMGFPISYKVPSVVDNVLGHFTLVAPRGKPEDSPALLLEASFDSSSFPLLADHVFNKTSLVPGTFWIELFAATANAILPPRLARSRVCNVEFKAACYTPPGEETRIRLSATCRDERSFDVTLLSSPAGSLEYSPCASCVIEFHPRFEPTLVQRMRNLLNLKIWASELETGAIMLMDDWYEMFRSVNFDFGPRFRLLDKQTVFFVRSNISSVLGEGTVKDRVRVELTLNSDAASDFSDWPYVVHPAILDAATQGMAVRRSDGKISSSLPWKVGEVIHFGEMQRDTKLTALLEVIHSSPDREIAHCIVGVVQDNGDFNPCVLLRDFTCKVVEANASEEEGNVPPYFEMSFSQQDILEKKAVNDADVLLIIPQFRNASSLTELPLSVAARLQRSTVVHSKTPAIPDECVSKKHSQLSLVVFLPSLNEAAVLADPVQTSFELLQDFLQLIQSVQAVQVMIPQVNLAIFTEMPCLFGGSTQTQATYHSIVGAFRAIVVEHGELSARLVQYDPATVSDVRLCEEIKSGWSQAKLESHCVLNAESRLVGVYEKIRSIGSQAPTASQLLTLTRGSWLIAGGCGAMGLLIAKYLVGIGATKIFLCSRRGVGDRDRAALEALPKDIVEVLCVDVTNFESLLSSVKSLHPPVRHVMNLAMVLHDKYIRSVSQDDVMLVGNPKIAGAWNLHRLESQLSEPFQTFVTTSSTTALVGTPGQYVYGSANCFMDGLVTFRRSQGLCGTSLQLGPVAGIGVLAREEGAAAKMLLERSGWIPHAPDALLNIFTDVFLRGAYLPAVLCPLQIAPNYFLPDHRRWKSYERLLQYIAVEEKGLTQATLDDALVVVKRILAQELRYSEDSIQSETSLNNLGVTSMIQNILALSIQENFSGVSIPQRFFLSPEVTPLAIAREIIERLAKLQNADAEITADAIEKPVSLIWGSGLSSKDALLVVQRQHEKIVSGTSSGLEGVTLSCVEQSSLNHPFRSAVLGTAMSTEEAQISDIRMKASRCIFVFPGQGTQFVGMAKPFYDTFSVFRSTLDTLLGYINERSYAAELQTLLLDPTANAARLGETKITQPALFLMEVALGRTLLDAGLVPCAVGGHSVGEIAAKTVVGELTLRDGVTLVITRAAEMSTRGHGKMAAVLMTERNLKAKLAEWGVSVYVGAVNGPQSTVVSGAADEVDRFVALCKANGEKVLTLPNAHAFHSPMMSAAKSGLQTALQSIRLSTGSIPVTSNLTGEWSQGQDVTFYTDQIDHCVQWDQCCDNLAEKLREVDDKQTKMFCLEVGPGSVLSSLMRKKMTGEDEFIIRQCCPQNDTLLSFMALLGELWCNVPTFSPAHLFVAGAPWVAHRRVTITGATTFLGIHCVEHFIKNTPCQLVLPLAGTSNPQRRLQVQEACDRYGVHSLDEDIASRVIFIDVDEFDEDSSDVLHVTTSMNSLADYESVKETNVIRATKLAELCIASGATLHYVSTMGVLWGIEYGDETQLPSIDKSWMSRHGGYTQSKIVMEHKLRSLAMKKGLRYCVYRVDMLGGSSTSGAVGPNSYYTSLLRTILRSKTCPSYMFGPTPRITVDEAAAQICTLAGSTHRFPQTYHITTGKELFSMREFAVGFETVPFDSFRESIQTDTEQPFLSLIDIRGDRHSQTPAQHQKSIEALVAARHSAHETNSTRLAATVRRWLETHE